MEAFSTLRSSAVPLAIDNVDTDQIIPARFLKATDKEGFGDNLFRDWRFDKQGEPKPDFPLNDSRYKGKILIAGDNFGCGSSREHAAWALTGYGFKAVVSSYFADIFRGNALNNGLLPIQVEPDTLSELFAAMEGDPTAEFEIDLQAQTLSQLNGPIKTTFDIDPYKKMCLVNGYDDIDFLVSKLERIEAFEASRKI